MSKCRFLTPCGICEIKSMSGIPYNCDLRRIGKLEEECGYEEHGYTDGQFRFTTTSDKKEE